MPPVGNHPVFAASKSISREKKTDGMERPANEINPVTRSTQVLRLTAASMPSGTASPHEIASAVTASSRVLKRRSQMSDQTGILNLNEYPKFPCNAWLSQY